MAAFLDESFVVAYGDVFTNLNLARLIAAHQQRLHTMSADTLATLALYRVPNPTECGLVEMDSTGRVTRFVEKPPADQVFTDLANAGVLVIEPSVIEHIPADTFYDFGHDLFPKLLAAGESIYGWKIPDGTYLLDIGSPEKYAQAQQDAPIEAGHLS